MLCKGCSAGVLTILFKSQVLINVSMSVCLAWYEIQFSDSHGRQDLCHNILATLQHLKPIPDSSLQIFLQYLVKIRIFVFFFFKVWERWDLLRTRCMSCFWHSLVNAGRECLGNKAYGDGFEFVRLLLVDCFKWTSSLNNALLHSSQCKPLAPTYPVMYGVVENETKNVKP